MEPIIEVKNLSKGYVLAHRLPYETFRDTLTSLAKKPLAMFKGKERVQHERFWALNNVNFSVQRGEAIGLIGANGSGKSTLLKILSQITSPTSGEIHLRGRVASLLEVGTGFHPELTGRENIYLNGAILGMSRKEIDRKFDEIVSFSGVEKFLDTPVKRYSSGMIVRLAFSVAAHMEPEILIVDEVLAVGDADFQKKSLGKMDEVTKGAGRTIIFVSHNMEAIKRLCTKCILLNDGQIEMYDTTDKVIEKYLHKHDQYSSVSLRDRKDRTGKGKVKFTDIAIANQHGQTEIQSGDDLHIALDYTSEFTESIRDVRVVVTVVNDDLQPVLRLDSDVTAESFTQVDPQGKIICVAKGIQLGEGRYFANVDFIIKGTSRDYVVLASAFNVKTVLATYNYRIPPDKSITNTLLQFNFTQVK